MTRKIIKYDLTVLGFHRAIQIVILVMIESSHEYIQMRVPRQMTFTKDKTWAHSVQNNPGCDAMSSCNSTVSTSQIVIINIDTVFDMSFIIWKCKVHVWLVRMTSNWYLL